ncbi:hypothetical protein BpHYR1_025257 [Brachionus plicatilis]|uniref:Uncharacterized protein n=1 Tax=Brachionus plicatilis TaxID=10195 RepID=A0A3M7SCU6_BRAPC|nr:hypothetical protein BpHYR1_025257 [Brachionus plicatilis]
MPSINITQPNSSGDNQFLSDIELKILRSSVPLEFNNTDHISFENQKFLLLNKSEIENWRGNVGLGQLPLNKDSHPLVINKKPTNTLDYVQQLTIRYLRPPTPKSPSPIVIKQNPDICAPPAPPLVIRQIPPEPKSPEPLIIRENPPPPPAKLDKKVIVVRGKNLPPPPRKVVIERLAPVPPKPPTIIIERWLPYSKRKCRVIYQKSSSPQMVVKDPKNVIVDWQTPEVEVEKKLNFLGVLKADPGEYRKKYGQNLKKLKDYPELREYLKNSNKLLKEDEEESEVPELEGDIDALKLVDLDKEGLGHYKDFVNNYDKKSICSKSLDTNHFLKSLLRCDLSSLKTSNSVEFFIDQVFESFNSCSRIGYLDARNIFTKYSARHGRKFNDNDFSFYDVFSIDSILATVPIFNNKFMSDGYSMEF